MTDYIRNFLFDLEKKYPTSNDNIPYGFSLIPKGEINEYDKSKLLKVGIVVIELEIESIPQFIFNIAQSASGFSISSEL